MKMNLKKKTMTVLFFLMVILGNVALINAQDWPMNGQNPGNTRYSSSYGPSTGDLQWVYATGENVRSSPVMVDGRVYINSVDKVYCLDADTGAWIWEYNAAGAIPSSPAVADGKVYVHAAGRVYCLDAYTGAWIWEIYIQNSPRSFPTVVDGMVFVASEDEVYCLDADTGDLIWDWSPDYSINSPVVADGKVYIYILNGEIYRLNAYPLAGGVVYESYVSTLSSPAVADGKIYINSEDEVYCFDIESEIWNFHTGALSFSSSPAVDDTKVYIGSEDSVFCLNAYTGAHIWNYTTGSGISSSPTVADNKVYIGSADGNLYCLNADTGALIWDCFIEEDLNSPVVADGKVYITSESGNVYCFGTTLEEKIASLEAENEALKTENAALRSEFDALTARLRVTQINLDWLPGTRINIYPEGEFLVSVDETTHIWQGWYSGSWSTKSEADQMEFLATTEWHLFVNGVEVSVTPLVVYDEDEDRVWSGAYRVFPPGYFARKNHKLIGEWLRMKDGQLRSFHHELSLRVK